MKTNLVCAALACVALAMTTTAAVAAVEPVPGVDVVVHSHPCHGCGSLMKGQTDGNGQIVLRGLAPGDYEIEIGGTSLRDAIDMIIPVDPKHGSSFLSIGGVLGGGSSHSSSGHEGEGHGHDSHSSGGGVGVGVSVPVGGGGNPDTNPMAPGIMVSVDVGGAQFSSTTPYCRGTAGGIRIGVTISDQASPGNLAAKPVAVVLSILDHWPEGMMEPSTTR
jgi:hypothetical protein